MNPNKSNPTRVFIAGGVNTGRLRNIYALKDPNVVVCGILAYLKYLHLSAEKMNIPTWFFDTLGNGTVKRPATPCHKKYDYCISALLADPMTLYIVERVYGAGGFDTIFNHTIRIEVACWNSLNILHETRPDRIVFMGITHHPMSWIFGHCAEYLGIPTYFTNASPLPWRYWPVRGIKEQSIVDIGLSAKPNKEGNELSRKTFDFIETNMMGYAEALPSNCSELRGREKDIWSWKMELKQQFTWKPLLLANNIVRLRRKHNLLLKYKQLTETYRHKKPFIVFFLHMQPESSTFPLGYKYAQQWLAVRALATSLPTGWTLVVREHPYQFVWNAQFESVRNADFYESIAALPNVVLAPMEITPFELIDGCEVIATITGTVGIQGLCRGKPVMAFGRASYLGCPGVFFVHDVSQVKKVIEAIQSGQSGPTREQLNRYLSWVESVSIEGTSKENSWDGNDLDTWSDAKNKLWEHLIRLHGDPSITMFPATHEEL